MKKINSMVDLMMRLIQYGTQAKLLAVHQSADGPADRPLGLAIMKLCRKLMEREEAIACLHESVLAEMKKQFPEFDEGQQIELARHHSRAVFEEFEAAGRAHDKQSELILDQAA